MSRGNSQSRSPGLGLAARFTIAMASSLIVVGGVGAWVLHNTSQQLFERQSENLLRDSVRLSKEAHERGYDALSTRVEQRLGVNRTQVRLADGTEALLYEAATLMPGDESPIQLFVAADAPRGGQGMLGLIVTLIGCMAAAAVGIAWWSAGQVTRPLQDILGAVRRLSHGDLRYRGKIEGGGEVALLARSLERMTHELEVAQEAELELSVRERELELAGELRENLLPFATPLIEGHDLAAMHLASEELSGSFHDFLELEDGRVGLLVCDVAGQGVPAAMVGAMARAALRAELSRGGDLGDSLARVNRELANSVKRGQFVTALFVLVDPKAPGASVACAGHRLPLVRLSAADGRLRVFQPEGIALALDPGPVFERTLVVQQLEFAPGDRLVLATQAAAELEPEDGSAWDEKRLWQVFQRSAKLDAGKFVKRVRDEVASALGETQPARDVSVVCIVKESA